MKKIPVTTNMGATAFDYALVETPAARPLAEAPSPNAAALELMHRVNQFLSDHILRRRFGKLPAPRTIAARLIAFDAVINPSAISLHEISRELRCSPAWLSKLCRDFASRLGIRTLWQRQHLAKLYAERARRVAAGDWEVSRKRDHETRYRKTRRKLPSAKPRNAKPKSRSSREVGACRPTRAARANRK